MVGNAWWKESQARGLGSAPSKSFRRKATLMIWPLSGAFSKKGQRPPGTWQRELLQRTAGAQQSPAHASWAQDHLGGRLHAWSPGSQEVCRRGWVPVVVRAGPFSCSLRVQESLPQRGLPGPLSPPPLCSVIWAPHITNWSALMHPCVRCPCTPTEPTPHATYRAQPLYRCLVRPWKFPCIQYIDYIQRWTHPQPSTKLSLLVPTKPTAPHAHTSTVATFLLIVAA